MSCVFGRGISSENQETIIYTLLFFPYSMIGDPSTDPFIHWSNDGNSFIGKKHQSRLGYLNYNSIFFSL